MFDIIKKSAKAQISGTGEDLIPDNVNIFEVPLNSKYLVFTTEIKTEENSLVYLKQFDSDGEEIFSVKYDMEKNDYVVFNHKLVFTQAERFVVCSDSSTTVVVAHILTF